MLAVTHLSESWWGDRRRATTAPLDGFPYGSIVPRFPYLWVGICSAGGAEGALTGTDEFPPSNMIPRSRYAVYMEQHTEILVLVVGREATRSFSILTYRCHVRDLTALTSPTTLCLTSAPICISKL